jgi:peptide/nickel transport system substrate-binding protein
VTSLDPAKGGGFQDFEVASALYDSLVSFNGQGQVVPQLATSWHVTPSTATFHLRSGVTCSDGTTLTPVMVAASLQRYMTPATAAPLLSSVIGGGNTARVTANNAAKTVTIKLARPWSQLLPALTSPYTGIICPSGLKNPSSLLTHSAGTGPYVAASEVSGASYTFKRRPGYNWGPAYASPNSGTIPKTLVMKVVEDENTAANLISTGSLDVAAFTSQNWTRFRNKSGYSTTTEPQEDAILVFNETPGHPTAKQSVRLAISEAINRDAVNKVLGNGAGTLETNIGQSTYQCYDPSLGSLIPAYNPTAAEKVLKGLNIKIIGTTIVASGAGTSYVLAELNQAGAKATLQNENNAAWVTQLFSGKNDWDVTMLGYGNTINSLLAAGALFTGPAPPKGENIGNVANTTAPKMYQKAGDLNGQAGCAATSDFQKSLLQGNDDLPIATVPSTTVFGGGTSGVVVKGFVLPGSIRTGA